MKRFTAIFIIICFVLSAALPVHADGPVKKLGRGVANVVTSPLEVPKGMGDVNETDGIFAGATWGVFKGAVDCVKRAVVGVYEIATFPVPVPKDYEPILDDPEFFLDKKQRNVSDYIRDKSQYDKDRE